MNRFTRSAAEAAWGDHEPEPYAWTCGPWRVEVRGDEIADIRYAGRHVLRSVRGVVREADWQTVPATVREATTTDDGLDLSLDIVGLGADIDARLNLRCTVDALSVSFDAYVRKPFRRSRIGLVVLHPADLAGRPLMVTSPGGQRTDTRYPTELAPEQPAVDIAGLAWSSDGLATELTFTGDVFEMEDQRNWTDASFKTYSTPLSRPFPVLVDAGHEVHQTVAIRCMRTAAVALSDTGRRWPAVGLGASTAPGGPVPVTLPVTYLAVELDARGGSWPAALDRAAEEAGARPLDVRIVADAARDLAPVLDALIGRRVVRLGVYNRHSQVSEPTLWAALRDGAHARGVDAELHGGARSHFTELSRARDRLPADLPALSFAITPQMHARERAQLVESVAMQQLVTESAVALSDGRPVHVGPVTLRPRYLTAAESPVDPDDRTDITAGYGAEHVAGATDPRQASVALGAWTVAVGIAHTLGGASSLTLYESWGPRGVVDSAGHPFPAAEAVGWLAEARDAELWAPAGSIPPDLWVAGARSGGRTVLLAANLSDVAVTVAVTASDGPSWTVDLEPYGSRRGVLRFDHHDSEGVSGWR